MNQAAAARSGYRHLGSTPASATSRGGASARYEPAFLRLEAEIAKLDSLAGDSVSWSAIRDDAALVLATSKDLLAAAYLTVSLHRTAGLAGLADGLGLCADLVRAFWADLHPVGRPRARRSALQWMSERVAQGLDGQESATDFELCRQRSDELWTLCLERFGAEDCGLGALRRATQLETPAPSAGDPVASSRQESQAMIAISTDRASAVAHLTAAADYFMRAEPHSPIGPLLQRALAWSGMSFEDVFAELLVRTPDAKAQVWQSLGIKSDND